MIKLFVVGIPRTMDASELKALLGEFGDVESATVITDQVSGESKGYGFVYLSDEVSANLAIRELDGTELDGRTLSVRLAERQPRPRKNAEVIPASQRQYEKVRLSRRGQRPRKASRP